MEGAGLMTYTAASHHVSASFLGSCHVVPLYIQSMVETGNHIETRGLILKQDLV